MPDLPVRDTLVTILDRHVSDGLFSGAVLVECGGDPVLAEARGYAHRGFRVPNRFGTRFDTASITKLFTAAAAFRLVDAGRLQLDERVRDIVDLGETRVPLEVTIRHCLTHTSGIGDDADEESGESYEELWKERPCYRIRETRDLLPQFVVKEPRFAPGTDCRYNNCAFVLAGLVLEARTGRSFRQVVEAEVFGPAGMAESRFAAKDDPGLDAA